MEFYFETRFSTGNSDLPTKKVKKCDQNRGLTEKLKQKCEYFSYDASAESHRAWNWWFEQRKIAITATHTLSQRRIIDLKC